LGAQKIMGPVRSAHLRWAKDGPAPLTLIQEIETPQTLEMIVGHINEEAAMQYLHLLKALSLRLQKFQSTKAFSMALGIKVQQQTEGLLLPATNESISHKKLTKKKEIQNTRQQL
jgi:predicted O-linked N-acetylglucosamine transferase (SPINDLY family)